MANNYDNDWEFDETEWSDTIQSEWNDENTEVDMPEQATTLEGGIRNRRDTKMNTMKDQMNASKQYKFKSKKQKVQSDLNRFVNNLKKSDKKRKITNRSYKEMLYNRNNFELSYNELCEKFNFGFDPSTGKKIR